MLPPNPLYELVPVTKETMPEGICFAVNKKTGEQGHGRFYGSSFVDKQKGHIEVTHYLRPLPPERMEEMVRDNSIEFANFLGECNIELCLNGWVCFGSDYSQKMGIPEFNEDDPITYTTEQLYKIFTDNLINEMSK